jgi:hypothetical protein
MPHWKTMMQKDFLFAFDLDGKAVTVTIDRVKGGELTGEGGKKTKKPLCYFREGRAKKPLALNSTNCKAIAAMYGNDTDQWVGKRITIFPTTTNFGSDVVDCIRVKPGIPNGKDAAPPPAEEPSESPEPGSDG